MKRSDYKDILVMWCIIIVYNIVFFGIIIALQSCKTHREAQTTTVAEASATSQQRADSATASTSFGFSNWAVSADDINVNMQADSIVLHDGSVIHRPIIHRSAVKPRLSSATAIVEHKQDTISTMTATSDDANIAMQSTEVADTSAIMEPPDVTTIATETIIGIVIIVLAIAIILLILAKQYLKKKNS
jgi:hypothetical protein